MKSKVLNFRLCIYHRSLFGYVA